MNIKSLLCAAALLSASGVAQAFPDYTLTPADGASLTSRQSFANFNLVLPGDAEIKLAEDASAILESDQGDEVSSTEFKDFSGMVPGTVIINFDENDIKVNGLWTLTIPAGSITVAGEGNPEITAVYTLNDVTLGGQEYPQIELISADPADGSKLPTWGGPDFTKLKLVTSDDAAVNSIDWNLYEISVDESGVQSKRWIRQGNDNRIDPNRYQGSKDDIWADGLFIAISETNITRLVEGRTYELEISFYGIGYDPETNQFPNPEQKEMSHELTTTLTYYGQTPPQEYSPYKYETISPDPNEYKITNPDLAHFTINYSGPVKPTEFIYAMGFGANGTAGEFAPAEGAEVDADGYASAWTFTFFKEVISDVLAGIYTSVATMDKDGLYVKGNAGYDFDDIYYSMNWECNCGAPALISVDPVDGAEVDALSSITVSNEDDLPMAFSYFGAPARILTMTGEEILTLGEPEYDGSKAIWTFDPITEPGTYILLIPDQYFNIGEEFEGSISNEATFTYIVKSSEPGEIRYDISLANVTPENESKVEEISVVTVTLSEVAFPVQHLDGFAVSFNKGALYKLTESGEELIEEVEPFDNPASDWMNPTMYDFTFTAVTADGSYKVVIPEGTFGDDAFLNSEGVSGNTNPEFVLNYVIGEGNGVESIFAGEEIINVFTTNGVQVLRDANIEAAKTLPSGLYIINGKKVMIRR